MGRGRGDVAGSDAAEEMEFGDCCVEVFAEESGHGGGSSGTYEC